MIEKRKALKKAWEIFKPFRKHFLVSLVMLAVYEMVGMMSPYFLGMTVNAAQAKEPIGKVFVLIGISFGVTMMAVFLGYLRDQYELRHLDFKVADHLINQTLEKVLGLSIGQHRSQNSGITQSVVTRGQSALRDITFLLLYTVFPIALTTITACAMLMWFSWRIGVIVVAGIILYLAVSISTTRKYYPEVRGLNDLGHRTRKYYAEILRLPTLIQVQAQENRVRREHADRLNHQLGEGYRIWIPYSLRMWVNTSILPTTRYLALALGMFLVYREGYLIGDFLIVWAWTQQALSQVNSINRLQRQLLEEWNEANKYFSLLDIKPAVEVVPHPIRPEHIRGKVEFIDVSFTYPEQRYIEVEEEEIYSEEVGSPLPALSNASFVINEGERVAFVGESGAGKSTIVTLLMRSYDPDSGQIKVDGHDLRLLDLKQLREALGVVEQNVTLFDNTLRYNLLFGLNGKAQDITEEQMERVARLSCIDRFQHRLVEGWDTMIGENGIKLSGGERQRVGIARALIKDSSILILDEATSNLDVENESLIKQAVAEASVGRTTIIIAHRLSTVRDADKIFVMSHGSIVGSGKHEELYETSDIYRNLINKQLFQI